MNDLSSYDELKKTIVKNNSMLGKGFEYLEKIIVTDTISSSYGRNIFGCINKQEIYILTNDKLVKVTWEPFILRTYDLSHIKNVELEIISECEDKLKIYFSYDDKIELSNKEDTNEEYRQAYFDYILNLAKQLTYQRA